MTTTASLRNRGRGRACGSPAAFTRERADVSGPFAYGTSLREAAPSNGQYVDQILNGVGHSTVLMHDLAMNLLTTTELGTTIPDDLIMDRH